MIVKWHAPRQMFSWTMELLSNINKIAFFSWLLKTSYLLFVAVPPNWDFSYFLDEKKPLTLISKADVTSCESLLHHECHKSRSEGELSGTGVAVVLWLSDVWVSVHRVVCFLPLWGRLWVIFSALLLPGHFLIDRNRRLWSVMIPCLHLQHITLLFTIN